MISSRARQIDPFIVMDILEKAKAIESRGTKVVHLEVGEPDSATPAPIVEAAVRALNEGRTQYTHSMGLPELREAIAGHYRERYSVGVSPDQVLVTTGTSPAMLLLFSALIDPGDRTIMSDPHYPGYPYMVKFFGGEPSLVPVCEEDGFQLVLSDVKKKITRRTKAILINSPANPTGALLTPDVIRGIAELGPMVVSDEIYHGLVYEGKEHSVLEFTDKACVINGFSKLYAMTGWRLGYVIVPRKMARPLQKLHQNFFISANAFVQWAGITALTDPQVKKTTERMRRVYDMRRKVMVWHLKKLGFGIPYLPGGAFYVFANAGRFGKDSLTLARDVLDKARVAVAPGIDFGPRGEGHLRFSYATSLENISLGMKRLAGYLR